VAASATATEIAVLALRGCGIAGYMGRDRTP
jgi:hypothetical protein